MTRLVPATPPLFAWAMSGSDEAGPDGLGLPISGLDTPAVLAWLLRTSQRMTEKYGEPCAWFVADGREVVGVISFKGTIEAGLVEIGYGIVEARQCCGYATRAVGLVIGAAARLELLLAAETALSNRASQVVLERNGFRKAGTRDDPDDGAVLLWRR